MNSVVVILPDIIVTRSRDIADFLTLGRWKRTCTLDFTKRILEERTVRLTRTTVLSHRLGAFDAVDYSYKCLGAASRNGVDYEADEYRVGLRFAANGEILPLALFRGTVETPNGLSALIASALPPSWTALNVEHELDARSFANLLCQKLQLELAI